MTSTILATYDHVEDARRVIDDLTEAGFKRGDIGLALYDPDNKYENYVDDGDVSGSEGASFGASFGGVLGAVVGLGAIAIPGIGPIVAAGPLAAALGALTGAAIGATSGAVAGASVGDVGIRQGLSITLFAVIVNSVCARGPGELVAEFQVGGLAAGERDREKEGVAPPSAASPSGASS